jgi:hypothetical protein
MPPTVPINHYFSPETNKIDRSHILLFHANVFKAVACLKHSNFLKVKGQTLNHTDATQRKAKALSLPDATEADRLREPKI